MVNLSEQSFDEVILLSYGIGQLMPSLTLSVEMELIFAEIASQQTNAFPIIGAYASAVPLFPNLRTRAAQDPCPADGTSGNVEGGGGAGQPLSPHAWSGSALSSSPCRVVLGAAAACVPSSAGRCTEVAAGIPACEDLGETQSQDSEATQDKVDSGSALVQDTKMVTPSCGTWKRQGLALAGDLL